MTSGEKTPTQLTKERGEGIAANTLINHPVIKDAISDMRESLYKQISKSTFWQKNEREEAYRMLRTLESFEGQFTRKINKGKKAANLLEQLKNKLKR